MFDANKVSQDVVNWIKTYFEETASPQTKAVVGVSGGKDSSVVLAACVAALGNDRVLGVLMPQGEQFDIDVAYEVCEWADVPYVEVNVGQPIASLYAELEKAEVKLNSVATFNTPARVRMTALYAVCGAVNGRVANTCNLSEDWVGYATKFGDGAGDFSPLSQLTVTEVRAVGTALGLPDHIVNKTPIDGLCGMTDEENLGFSYATLDKYIREGVCEDQAVKDKIDRMQKANLHKLRLMPAFQYSPEA